MPETNEGKPNFYDQDADTTTSVGEPFQERLPFTDKTSTPDDEGITGQEESQNSIEVTAVLEEICEASVAPEVPETVEYRRRLNKTVLVVAGLGLVALFGIKFKDDIRENIIGHLGKTTPKFIAAKREDLRRSYEADYKKASPKAKYEMTVIKPSKGYAIYPGNGFFGEVENYTVGEPHIEPFPAGTSDCLRRSDYDTRHRGVKVTPGYGGILVEPTKKGEDNLFLTGLENDYGDLLPLGTESQRIWKQHNCGILRLAYHK